jgi:hypothetical protein
MQPIEENIYDKQRSVEQAREKAELAACRRLELEAKLAADRFARRAAVKRPRVCVLARHCNIKVLPDLCVFDLRLSDDFSVCSVSPVLSCVSISRFHVSRCFVSGIGAMICPRKPCLSLSSEASSIENHGRPEPETETAKMSQTGSTYNRLITPWLHVCQCRQFTGV